MSSSKIRIKQIEPIFLVGRHGVTGSQTGPTDGTYGFFNSANLQDDDLMEDAFDKVVGILDALVPPAAPDLSSISFNQTGVSGNLSWGTSNAISDYDNHTSIDSNGLYSVSGNSRGLLADVSVTGTLANNVSVGPGTPFPAYPANSFGNADQGTLELKLDGVVVHTTTLSSFISGSSLNANGSGFILSVATASVFPTGAAFENFKYRTGTYVIGTSDHITNYGYKTIQVEHVDNTTNSTQIYNYAVDENTNGLTFSSEALSSLVMSGSRYLSGVEYHTSGTADYDITAAGVYQNSYSDSGSAISHTTTTNCSVSSSSIPAFSVDEFDNVIVSKTATVDSSSVRILNAGLTVNTRVLRTVQANQTSSGDSAFNILLDTITTGHTNTNEPMNAETFRLENSIESNLDDITGWVSGGASDYTWDSTKNINAIGNPNHNNGLLLYNGALRYPTNAPNSGDFSTIVDGPAGNVDYSVVVGERVYYRFYYIQSAQNFDLRVAGSNTTFVAATNIGSLSGNQVAIELLAPSQTTDGATTEWKDCTVSYTTDNAIGCYSSSNGSNVGSVSSQAWGLTTGGKTTANSGDAIVLKITAPSTWSGNLSQINITKL